MGSREAPDCDRQLGILDVLREASVLAADTLYDGLKELRCLSNVRLTCRGLRNAVDGSVRHIALLLTAEDKQRWLAGHLPSLARWPRCSSVRVDVEMREPGNEAALVALPFAGLPLAAMRRITHLAIRWWDSTGNFPAEAVASALIVRLPMLRQLDLSRLWGVMSYDPLQQQYLYDALATLPHLEHLTLPSCRSLERVSALAGGSLRRLEVRSRDGKAWPLHTAMVASLASLDSLQELYLDAFVGESDEEHNALVSLLSSPPSALRTLGLVLDGDLNYARISLTAARMATIDICEGPVSLGILADLAQAVLLPSLGVGQQLQLLRVDTIGIASTGGSLEARELDTLLALVQRCTRVELKLLQLGRTAAAQRPAQVQAALQAIGLLGAPRKLGIMMRLSRNNRTLLTNIFIGLVFPPHAAAGAQLPPRSDGVGPPPLPTGADVVKLTVQSMVAAATTMHPGNISGAGGSALGLASSPPELLVLRGPFVAAMVQLPALRLGQWMERLEEAASPHAGDGSSKCISAHRVLQPAAAILLACSDRPGAAAAVVRAAESMVEQQAASGALEVVAAASSVVATTVVCFALEDIDVVFLANLRQTMQEAWDSYQARHSHNACGCLRALLEWMLVMRDEVLTLVQGLE